MNKKNYQRPAMKAVKLQQQHLLVESDMNAVRNGYGEAEESTWE